MRISKTVLVSIIAGGLLTVCSACDDKGPEMPAPGKGNDGTTEFSKASGMIQPESYSHTQTAQDNIAAQNETIRGAIEALDAANQALALAMQVLAELEAQAPQKGEGESDEAYQKRVADHQSKVAAAQKQVERAQAAVSKALAAVDAAQKELQRMQRSDLPAAQQKDVREMERYLEEERKKLEAASEQVTSSVEEKTKDTDTRDESTAPETKDGARRVPLSSTLKASSVE